MSNLLPEHEKLKKIQPFSQAIYDFLEWCEQEKIYLGQYEKPQYDRMLPCSESREKLLARHFDIDLVKLENEKRQLLAELQP